MGETYIKTCLKKKTKNLKDIKQIVMKLKNFYTHFFYLRNNHMVF